MDDLVADEFVDMVIELRQEVKAIKKRLRLLEEEVGIEEEFNRDYENWGTDD